MKKKEVKESIQINLNFVDNEIHMYFSDKKRMTDIACLIAKKFSPKKPIGNK